MIAVIPKAARETGTTYATRVMLGAVVLLATMLRIWGLDFGLPYLYHPDEPVGVWIPQGMLKTGDLNPHFFHWPSLLFYLNAAAYIPYYWIGHLRGAFHSLADIPEPIVLGMGVGFTPLASSWLLGRGVTAAFSVASVVLVFLIGRNLTSNPWVGLLAALLMAVSPTNVTHGRYITPDTLGTFFVLLSFWGSVNVFRAGSLRDYVIAGLGVGLAAASKYNAGLVVLPLIVAHFLRHGWHGVREVRLYVGLLVGAVGFVVAMPFAVLDYPAFLNDFLADARHYSTGHSGMEGDTLQWYVWYLGRFEGPVAAIAVLAALLSIARRNTATLLLAVFPVVYFAIISRLLVRNDRTILPLTPFLFLLASYLIVAAAGWMRARWQPTPRPVEIGLGVATAFLVIWPLVQTVDGTRGLTRIDSRTTARVWIDANTPPGSHIALEAYSAYADPQRFVVEGFGSVSDYPPEWYVQRGFQYLVIGENMFGRFYREPERYPIQVTRYEALFDAFDLVKTFTDGGYEIRIYHVH